MRREDSKDSAMHGRAPLNIERESSLRDRLSFAETADYQLFLATVARSGTPS